MHGPLLHVFMQFLKTFGHIFVVSKNVFDTFIVWKRAKRAYFFVPQNKETYISLECHGEE